MKRILTYILPLLAAMAAMTGCKDTESYADMLRDETQAVNSFLADYPVIDVLPPDSVLISMQDVLEDYPGMSRAEAEKLTPFYRMDDDGHVYMQVINPGSGTKAADNQLIYFRFTRYNLIYVHKYGTWEGMGNSENLGSTPTSFRFNDTQNYSTTQWGEGIQVPLRWLYLDCEVRIVIKSYLGPTEEVTAVYPYLYEIRYFPSRV